MPSSLPKTLKTAAEQYSFASLDDPSMLLVSAFGFETRGDLKHRQVCWLCCLAVRRVLYGWKIGNCEGDKPSRVLESVESWVVNSTESEWQTLSKPAPLIRNGHPITDCDAARLGPIADAAAGTSRFASKANIHDAVEVLDSVWIAVNHGVHYRDELQFENWLTEIALPASLEFTVLTPGQLRR